MHRPALCATPLLLLLAACGSAPSGEDLIGPFEDGAERAYQDADVDRSETGNLANGVIVEECWVIDADGAQAIGEAAYGDGDYATSRGSIFGQVGEELLGCPITRDGERSVSFSVSTTKRDLDELLALREEVGFREVQTPDTELDEDAVLLTGDDDGVNAVWLDGGFQIGVGGRDLDAEAAVAALEVAVDAVADHLAE